MCEQCQAATESYSPSEDKVLGKYFLVRATKDGDIMKSGQWGLVTCNDPDFMFSVTPWPNPFFYLTWDEQDKLSKEDEAELLRWDEAAETFSKQAMESMGTHWGMDMFSYYVHHAQKAGWVPPAYNELERTEGHRLSQWLFQYLGEYLVRHPSPLTDEQLQREDLKADWEREKEAKSLPEGKV